MAAPLAFGRKCQFILSRPATLDSLSFRTSAMPTAVVKSAFRRSVRKAGRGSVAAAHTHPGRAHRSVASTERPRGKASRQAIITAATASRSAGPLESYEHLEELSRARHLIVVPDFLPSAARLRETFDKNFEEPRQVHMNRFCWDYWHVPGQYTQLRTFAKEYFSEEDYEALENALLAYGKEELGCIGITPIWLSYYVDGCGQELHCDNPHGPWAFVLSLTDWEARAFSGGETAILSDLALNFWSSFASDTVVEHDKLVTLVEPHFNQLAVFDPRFPHGVRTVEGVREPTKSRIVLHGWFTEPEMFVEGAMSYDDAREATDVCMERILAHIADLPEATGTLVVRVHVDADGSAQRVSFLTDTLVARPWDVRENDVSTARAQIQLAVRQAFSEHSYPVCDGPSVITFPIVSD